MSVLRSNISFYIAAFFIAFSSAFITIDRNMFQDEGTSICRAESPNYKFFYDRWDEDKYPYGTTFVEHYPTFFMILKAWRSLVSDTKIGMRVLSVLFYSLSFLFFIKILRKIGLEKYPLYSLSSLYLLLPSLASYSTYIREYTLFLLLTQISLFYYFQLFEEDKKESNASTYFLIASLLGSVVFYFFNLYFVLLFTPLVINKHQRQKLTKKINLVLITLISLNIATKTPALLYHRLFELQRVTQLPSLENSLNEILQGFIGLFYIEQFYQFNFLNSVLILCLALIYLGSHFYVQRGNSYILKVVSNITILSLLLFMILRFGFKVKEVDFRYFLFIPALNLILLNHTLSKTLIFFRKTTIFLISFIFISYIYLYFFNIKNTIGSIKEHNQLIDSIHKLNMVNTGHIFTNRIKLTPCLIQSYYETLYPNIPISFKQLNNKSVDLKKHQKLLLFYDHETTPLPNHSKKLQFYNINKFPLHGGLNIYMLDYAPTPAK